MKILTVFTTLLCFMGCQKKGDQTLLNAWMRESEKLRVLSTTAMIDDLVVSIGGDAITSLVLIKGEVDPHQYELVKGDGETFECADLVFCNGLGLEHGASVRHHLEQHPHAVFIGDVIAKRVPNKILAVGGARDPHLWMDISLWAEAIDPIVAAFAERLPEKEHDFVERGRRLKGEMLAKHWELKEALLQVPRERRYLVTSHDAFHYFSRAYLAEEAEWEDRCAAPEGLAPDGQLSGRDIQRIIDHLCRFHIQVVFPESNVSRESLQKIVSSCASKGLKVSICQEPLYGDAMGQAVNYLSMIEHNATTIIHAWEDYDGKPHH